MPGKQSTMWFRLPVGAGAPPLVSEAVGIERIVAHPAGSYEIIVSVLDSVDARLLRAGITVAHRRRDGAGEWYVAAPTWPGLPNEVTYELDSSGELPSEVRHKLQLFLRQAPIAPFATMECRRREYTLRGADGDVVEIRDDVITILRGDQVRSTTREITMTPLVPLTGQQRDFIQSAMAAIDAVALERQPTLQQRIGPPATGLTSFREPAGIQPGMTLEEFVSEVFLIHLHRLLHSELVDDARLTREELESVLRDLRGLSSVLEPSWRADFEGDVKALPSATEEDRGAILVRIMDALVSGVRAPKLGDVGGEPAREVLFARTEQALLILFDRCRALDADSSDDAWYAALRSAEQLDAAAAILDPLFKKPLRKARKELQQILRDLRMSVAAPEDIELVGLSAEEAFNLGRDVEHAKWTLERARARFVEEWPNRVPRVRKLLKKMRKKLK